MSDEQNPTNLVIDLRQRIKANVLAGRAETDGISKEDLKAAVLALRNNRAGGTSSLASKQATAKAAAMPLGDLLASLGMPKKSS